MFSCKHLTVSSPDGQHTILADIQAQFPAGGLNAVVGPSGCGKTTLMKALLGLTPSQGEIYYGDDPCTGNPSGRAGLVPQFSVAQAGLTVKEALFYSYTMLVSRTDERDKRIHDVMELVGLSEHENKRVAGLSGGQLRRLGLALELVVDPECLICDEVTSGLDPLSEDQILALLRNLADHHNKTFICIIHNLAKLANFDHITVLYEGYLIFQGSFSRLKEWFEIEDPLKLYHSLAKTNARVWAERWRAHDSPGERTPRPQATQSRADSLPGPGIQLITLLRRRLLLLMRDTGYLGLLAALTFGFPCIVVIFALGGLPQIEGLALERTGSFIDQLQQNLRYQIEAAETASLVTGLIMFQVVLLTLMGANNGAREIADERRILEKEKINGLRPWCFAASKLIFTGVIAGIQGFWMALFVKVICQFPGQLLPQALILMLCCIAMTWVCLALSAHARSAEKASLLSIYLVGFQLPLSGIVLALPEAIVWLLRPFINAYWSWAGYFVSMKDYQLYDVYRLKDASWLPDGWVACAVLSIHALISIILVIHGCQRNRWH